MESCAIVTKRDMTSKWNNQLIKIKQSYNMNTYVHSYTHVYLIQQERLKN